MIPTFLLEEIQPTEVIDDDATWMVPCEVYSRIVGYLRPVQNWNAGKQAEFEARALFDSVLEQGKLDEI